GEGRPPGPGRGGPHILPPRHPPAAPPAPIGSWPPPPPAGLPILQSWSFARRPASTASSSVLPSILCSPAASEPSARPRTIATDPPALRPSAGPPPAAR